MSKSSLAWLRKQSLNILSMLAGWHIASKYTSNPLLESMGGILAGALANRFNDAADKEISKKSTSKPIQNEALEPTYRNDHAKRLKADSTQSTAISKS